MPTIKKTGEKISWREAGKRFKAGVEGITQVQQSKVQIQGTWISILGIILGIIVNAFYIKQYWWVLIILVGALIVTLISQVGQYQKYWAMKRMEDQFKSIDLETINNLNLDNLDNNIIKEDLKEDEILEQKKEDE